MLHLLIVPSFALSEGDGGYGAPDHRGMNSQLPGSPTAPLNSCLSRLRGLTQATALAACTEFICCLSKSSIALLGRCQLVRDRHTVCLLTELQAALHTSPSKGSWGLSLKAAGHQTCCLLTPQGTRFRLSQPNKPRH